MSKRHVTNGTDQTFSWNGDALKLQWNQISSPSQKHISMSSCGAADSPAGEKQSSDPSGPTYLLLSCSRRPNTSLRSGPDRRCRSPGRWACVGRRRASRGWTWPVGPRREWSLAEWNRETGWNRRKPVFDWLCPLETKTVFTRTVMNSSGGGQAVWVQI